MTRKILNAGLLVVAAGLLTGVSALADDDPAIYQTSTGSNCAGGVDYWCTSAGLGTDPNTGNQTLEYLIRTSSGSGSEGITEFTQGWVAYEDGSTVEDLLDFVVTPAGKDEIFLYCGNAYCTTGLDVGLPVMPTNYTIVQTAAPSPAAGSTSYTPCKVKTSPTCAYAEVGTSTYPQPGYAPQYNAAGSTTAVYNAFTIEYTSTGGITSGVGKEAVPEPSSLLLLSSMMIGLAFFVRTKFSART